MAGQDNSKRQNRQHSSSVNDEKNTTVLGYVKNVTEKVDASLLKAALLEHGKLAYFDVSRQKVTRFPSGKRLPLVLTFSHRIVLSLNSRTLQATTAQSLPVRSISAVSRSGWKNDALAPMPTAVATTHGATCVEGVGDQKVGVVAARDAVATLRMAGEAVMLRVEEVET